MSRLLTHEQWTALCAQMDRDSSRLARQGSLATSGRRAQAFDFRRPNPVRRPQLRRLEALHEQLTHAVGGMLSTELRLSVQAELSAVEQVTYSEFQSALAPASGNFLFRCPPLTGACVITVDPGLCSVLLNRVFGGNGEPEPGIRELTSIERRGLLCLLDPLRTEIESHWCRASGRRVQISRFENLPPLSEPSAPGETVIRVTLALRLPGVAGSLQVCYPHAMIAQFTSERDARTLGPMPPGTRRAILEQGLRRTRLPVSVRLPTVGLPLAQVATMRPGHIIELKYTDTDRVQVLLNGHTRYVAAIGHVGRRRAVRIQQNTS